LRWMMRCAGRWSGSGRTVTCDGLAKKKPTAKDTGDELVDGRCKIAIVCAVEREARPLVNGWRVERHVFEGRKFKFFAEEDTVLVCSRMGHEAGRRATEAVVHLYRPSILVSAGYAGALEEGMKVGDVFRPATVIDGRDSSRVSVEQGSGILVSFDEVAGPEQKAKLAKAYNAQAVDMEGSSVARGAEKHGLGYVAFKVISDPLDFPMPPVTRFIGSEGELRAAHFVWFLAFRPWLWRNVLRLARHCARASKVIARALPPVLETVRKEQLSWQPEMR
jgi:adenosylhomocysteine nucleosidase